MQDLSREELSLLQNACDKDSIMAHAESSLERMKFGRTPDSDRSPNSIKLEDTTDAFPWHTTTSNIGSNLL